MTNKVDTKSGLKELLRRFSPYFKDYKFEFFLAIIGMIMAAVAAAGSAWLIDPVLNKIFIEKNETLLYTLPYAVVVLYMAKSGGTYMQKYYTAFIGQDIIRRFREKLVGNLLNLDMKFFNQMRTGELISRTINDIDRIRSVVSNLIPEFFMNLFQILLQFQF